MRGLILFKGSLMKRLIWPYVGLLAFLISCSLKGFNDSGPIAYQTEILAAYAIPKTVAPGDTTQFVCIIADSTNNKYKFYWFIPDGTPIGGEKLHLVV